MFGLVNGTTTQFAVLCCRSMASRVSHSRFDEESFKGWGSVVGSSEVYSVTGIDGWTTQWRVEGKERPRVVLGYTLKSSPT